MSKLWNMSQTTEGSDFLFKQGEMFTIKINPTCASENLIYVITCPGCRHHYIGQISMTWGWRVTLHNEQIWFLQTDSFK